VVFYGIAATLIALHFWPDADASPRVRPLTKLEGITEQGRAIRILAGKDGARALDMTFRARCTYGRPWLPRWWPAEGAPVHFFNRGRAFSVRESTYRSERNGTHAHIESWMNGRESPDRRTAWGEARLTGMFQGGPYRRTQVCDSGVVRWTVQRP